MEKHKKPADGRLRCRLWISATKESGWKARLGTIRRSSRVLVYKVSSRLSRLIFKDLVDASAGTQDWEELRSDMCTTDETRWLSPQDLGTFKSPFRRKFLLQGDTKAGIARCASLELRDEFAAANYPMMLATLTCLASYVAAPAIVVAVATVVGDPARRDCRRIPTQMFPANLSSL